MTRRCLAVPKGRRSCVTRTGVWKRVYICTGFSVVAMSPRGFRRWSSGRSFPCIIRTTLEEIELVSSIDRIEDQDHIDKSRFNEVLCVYL